ncbi:hypothetical protein LTR62_007015 [Meristemomyces frigidus]|uniref:Methylated-DNA--protein-cysteine methyltransferase n=1 Tax=Meristemomyces frigidus TaxID=1508187 RepID=A0AAN7YPA7_9PEZI|nr:hypothetical protein LTR62_007015 [Meristemomyces frigidus]
MDVDRMEELRKQWTYLYKDYLPSLAKARDPVQKCWPVYLDHCFARIVLDNAVGVDKPWMEAVKQPAVKHMSEQQLKDAIALAEQVATGDASLEVLDRCSLELRGKSKKRKVQSDPVIEGGKKQKQKQKTEPTISAYFLPSPGRATQGEGVPVTSPTEATAPSPFQDTETAPHPTPNMNDQIKRIATSTLTPFRKQTLTLLCQVPRGRYSTYQALSDHITATSHKTCARAVGSAMRNNPFAPEVPCHRILAADGSLGGFGGQWGELGRFAGKKKEILGGEGVRFDGRGRVKGPPFREFT